VFVEKRTRYWCVAFLERLNDVAHTPLLLFRDLSFYDNCGWLLDCLVWPFPILRIMAVLVPIVKSIQ
jgi:hypothetical protein